MRTEHHSGEEWLSATELGEWLGIGRSKASGMVRSLPSSITSPLTVSMRQRQEYLSPMSNPAVVFGCSLLPSISRADPPSWALEPV